MSFMHREYRKPLRKRFALDLSASWSMKALLPEEEEEPPEQAGRRQSGVVPKVDLNDEYGNLGNYGIRANLLNLNEVADSRYEAVDSLALIPFQDSGLLIAPPLINGDMDLDTNEAVIIREAVDFPIMASQGELTLFGFKVQKCPH
ncbi:hypothetical protein ACFX1X_022648 [Malus domestica]